LGKKISLVLSSGGARGLAQIGAIEALSEHGFEIVSVSGSSVGAAIGGLYAAGKLKAYKEWVIQMGKIDVFRLFDINFTGVGLIKGERVFEAMEKVIGDCMIEDMPIPFTAVATDIFNNKDVYIQKGSLFKAIRVLSPVYTENSILVDGGVCCPIPVEPVLNINHEMIVVVNVNADIPYKPLYHKSVQEIKEQNQYLKYLNDFKQRFASYLPESITTSENTNRKKKPEKLGSFDLFNRSVELMQEKIIDYTLKKYPPDMIINMSRSMCTTFEFYKAKELIEEGYNATVSVINSNNNGN
jgi:NTE family protein